MTHFLNSSTGGPICVRGNVFERERDRKGEKERKTERERCNKTSWTQNVFSAMNFSLQMCVREEMTKLTVWKLHHLVGFHRLTWSNPSFLIGRKPSHVAAFVRPHWRGVKCPRQSTLCMFWSEKVVFLFFSFFAWSIMLSSWMEEHFAQFTWDQIYFFVLHFWSSLSLYYIFHFSSCNI